jgi:hypothetical protein
LRPAQQQHLNFWLVAASLSAEPLIHHGVVILVTGKLSALWHLSGKRNPCARSA